MTADRSGRRYLIAVGITAGLTKSGPQIVASVGQMTETLRDDFGYERVTSLDIDPPTEQIRKEIREFCLACGPDDVVVLYYTGHALLLNGKHRLWTGDTVDAVSGTLEAGHLAELMMTQTPLGNALIIIDACFAGRGGADALLAAVSAVGGGRDRALAVLSAADTREQIVAGDFARLFASAVKQPSVAGYEPQFLALGAIAGVIHDDKSRPQWQTVSASVLFGKTENLPFFPNPRYRPQLRGLDVLTQLRIEQQELRLAELRLHFLPRARGVDVPTEAGWRFVGRKPALRDLVTWLSDPEDRSARIVTGGPGSGKSAVVGRLVVLSNPDYRRTVPADGLDPDTCPPEGSIAAGVHARGLTNAQVLEALCAAAGVTADTPADLLRELHGRRLTVAIDAIDEALDPDGLVAGVLRPLVEAGPGEGLSLLLGTRPHLLEQLDLAGSATVINLDDERYADPESIYQYVLRGLEAGEDSPYASAGPGLVADVARAVADAAGLSFLVALIVTRTLLSQPLVPDPADARWRASLPGTAADALDRDLETRLGAEGAERARDMLRPLAFAAGAGLPWENLWAPLASVLSGRAYTDEDLIRLRRQAGSYVVEAEESGRSVYRLYHAALAEALRRDHDAATVNEAFAAFLIGQVPATPSRNWSRAHPYSRAHLATHARQGNLLDDLLRDPGYLVNAVPAGLLAALPDARSRPAERAGVAYQRAVHLFRDQPEQQCASYLEFAAQIARAPELAARVNDRFPDRPWSVPWTHWPPEYPHQIVGGHLGEVSDVLVLNAAAGKPAVLSVGADARLRTWDLQTAEPTGDYPVGSAPLVAARAIRLSGQRVAIVILSADGLLHLWDLATARLTGTFPVTSRWRRLPGGAAVPGYTTPADLTLECLTVPGERHFALVDDGAGASVWELPSGRPIAFLPWPADPAKIGYLEGHDGRAILVAQLSDRGHWLFDVQEMRELPVDNRYGSRSLWRSLRGRLDLDPRVRGYASPNGEPVVAVRYAGGRAEVWDLATSRPLGTWPVSEMWASVRLGNGTDVHVPLYETGPDPDLSETGLRHLGPPRTSRSAGADRQGLRTQADGRFLRVEFSDGGKRPGGAVLLAGHSGDVTGFDVVGTATGHMVVTGSRDGTVRRWDIDWSRPRRYDDDLVAPDQAARAVTRIASVDQDDGTSLGLATGTDGEMAVWDLRTGEFIGNPYPGSACAADVTLLDGEPVAVIAGTDGAVSVRRLSDGGETGAFPGDPTRWPSAITSAVLPDGSVVAVTSGHGRKAVVWDLRTGRMRRVLAGHRAWTSCVARVEGSGSRPVVLTGGLDNRVTAWDLGRRRRRRFRVAPGWDALRHPFANRVRAISAFRLADGTALVFVSSLDGVVRVFKAKGALGRARMAGMITADVVIGAVLTGGLPVVVTAAGGIVRVWDATAFPVAPGGSALREVNVEVPVTAISATNHDVIVLATPNGLTAIRIGARPPQDGS